MFAAGKWQPLAEPDFIALTVGGTYSVAVDIDVVSKSDGWSPGPATQSEKQTASGNADLECQFSYSSYTGDNPCHARLITKAANITINASDETEGGTYVGSYIVNNLQFYRSLASVSGERYINLSNTDLHLNQWDVSMSLRSKFSTLVFGEFMQPIFGNVSEDDFKALWPTKARKLVSASSRVSLTVSGESYEQTGIVGGQFLTVRNMGLVDVNGTMSFEISFTPFPP